MAFYGRFLSSCTKPVNIYSIRTKTNLPRRIDKVLIANRGEIACRVIRTARKLGIKSVAVYSNIDQCSLHVGMADEAYNIGPASVQESSYLRGEKLLEVAVRSGSQAIHPGYGFLSENVEFAEACEKHGIIFIGPPASAIRDMGVKSTSKAIMSAAGVPIIEGYHGDDQSDEKLVKEAEKLGFPIMIKAIYGGGGKGMRIAHSPSEFLEALGLARDESRKAFTNSNVLLEKYVKKPRHVEVQVFADTYGNTVHLFERDCSVQRRHQKIIEEAPAPGLSEEIRQELGAAAVRAAKAVGYVGAGTVEFIFDRYTNSFHFMEMNTRLQVEHPITEMITKIDLVEWQLNVAAGEPLPVRQEDITRHGHAFEARVYAEDPRGGFLPGAGILEYLSLPEGGPDVRVETGVTQGDEVSIHYDPMIAKLVVWGKDRMEALSKLRSNLVNYQITGLETNINFLLTLSRHPEFVNGNVHTDFISDHNNELFPEIKSSDDSLTQAALTVVMIDDFQDIRKAAEQRDHYNPFVVESGFRVNYHYERKLKFKVKDETHEVKIKYIRPNEYQVSVNNGNWKFVKGSLDKFGNEFHLSCQIVDVIKKCVVFKDHDYVYVFGDEGKEKFGLEKPKYLTELTLGERSSSILRAVTPMPGLIDKILVQKGDIVKQNDPLFVMIAMKMEYIVKADCDGKVADILFKVGQNVPKDAIVIMFEKPAQ